MLDVGTGPGAVAGAAQAHGCPVIGMDSDWSMVALAKHRLPDIPFVRAALPHVPCRDNSFGAVTANFVINHTPDPRRAVQELFRITHVGGHVAATIWTAALTPLNRLWNDVMHHAGVTPPAGTRLRAELDFERTRTGLTDLFASAGFTHITCTEPSWTSRIPRDDLWTAVEAGIALIGSTYRAQGPAGRDRLRAAYVEITERAHPSCVLTLPSTALLAVARREH